jgi:hypothetical protein
MLLETINIRENDIIIYSRNSMDEEYNFRIIFKNDPHAHHRLISFEHVKKLITEYFPKNLIAYQILCNFPDITISNINYGCVIMVDNIPELIFTDPVFAVQTIEEYIQHNHNIEFRFRIQQVGYTTINKVEGKANFKEEFVFDLKMDEAINQNDEIFVKPFIEKQITSRKRKKSGREIKGDIIFKPEKQKSSEILKEDKIPSKTRKEIDTLDLAKRYERVAEGEMNYNGNRLNLGKIERVQAEKKQIEFPFVRERRISIEDYQIIESSRTFQQKLRKPIKEDVILSNDYPNNLRLNFSSCEMNKEEEFQKVQSSTPVTIRKVDVNKNGLQKQVEMEAPKNHKDDLFSNFLNNLQSESVSKIRKEKKRYEESDIIQMFKSLQSGNSNQDSNQNSNIIITTGKNGKLK